MHHLNRRAYAIWITLLVISLLTAFSACTSENSSQPAGAGIDIQGKTLKTTITGQKNRDDTLKTYDTSAPDITLP